MARYRYPYQLLPPHGPIPKHYQEVFTGPNVTVYLSETEVIVRK